MSNFEQLFERWLSGELSPEEQQKVEHELSSDPTWHGRILAARQVDFYSSTTDIKAVPKWEREITFDIEHQPWWHWQGMPALSMAFSCFALVLVIFKVEFSVNDNGMLVSFGGNDAAQQQYIVDMMDEKLSAFTQQQQLALADYSVEQLNKQQQSNLQLASYILDTSRQERKEDISDFVQYLNEQRKDDQLEQRIKFRQLEDAIQYQAINLTSNKLELQPASWAVEE